MCPYLDDIFHAQASLHQVCLTQNVRVRLHFSLGFIVNLKKSALVPTQVLLHLGGMINTRLSGCNSASSARAPEIDRNVGSSLHASDSAHGIMPCPRPTMLVPPSTSVDPPGGSLRLEVRSTHDANSSAPGCSGNLGRTLEST